MSTNADEVAYCLARVAQSTALAAAATDSCARASHVGGIAMAYGERLAMLTCAASPPMLVNVLGVQSARVADSGAEGTCAFITG